MSLGDSHTAGALLLDIAAGPLACLRSTSAYPTRVSTALGIAHLRDASCSGAKTFHMKAPQPILLGQSPPQFTALTRTTDLVTLGIGLNDTGLNADFGARLSATSSRLGAILREIHKRSPDARVVVVGYVALFPRDGRSCPPFGASTYIALDAREQRLNEMLAQQAAANDAEFADTYRGSVGHDGCAPLGVRWTEGLIPTSLAAPIHPNSLGERAIANDVLGVLRQPRPAPELTELQRDPPGGATKRTLRVTFALNRPAAVTTTIARRLSGRQMGATCRKPTPGNRGMPACYRFAKVLRTVHADGALGPNRLAVSVRRLRKPGRYRFTAFASSGDRDGNPQTTPFRIRHKRHAAAARG